MTQWINESMNRWNNEPMNLFSTSHAPMNQWINEWKSLRDGESMSQWINERVSQWVNESVNQWSNEREKWWVDESLNQCIKWTNNESPGVSANQWFDSPVKQWINELMSWCRVDEWMNQWSREWRNEWMNERMNWAVSYFFVGLLLHRAAFSLRHLFCQLFLLCATPCLGYFFSDRALGCLAAASSAASATQFFSSRNCYNVFSNLQLQTA